ncbi:WD40 repeat domain-containing protein [Alicyclobacillus herbarius]|uniref:WD40 repeat domain-containing protein n=1 Tax=Alicyclobacillus herbarius TaxID=122960 RepID=UPI0003F9F65C|nr:WD40 repeat domain-containing protein [Alicyclobacillus herbarius]
MHKGPITAVVVSHDDKYVYTAGYDKCIYEWDRKTLKSRLLGTHDHLVNGLCLSHNGRYLASCSSDYTINVYDLLENRLVRTFRGHADDVEAVTFGLDDTVLISASRDTRCLVWDFKTGAILVDFRCHKRDVLSVWAFRDRVFSAGDDGHIFSWNILTGEVNKEKGPFEFELDTISGCEANNLFAVGADDGSVIVYEADTLELLHILHPHNQGVKRIKFSPTGEYLLTAGYDHFIRIWDTQTWSLQQTLAPCVHQWERSLVWSHDEQTIFGASFGVRYCEWSVSTGEYLGNEERLSTPSINDLAVSMNGDIATASDDGKFRVNGEEISPSTGTLTNAVGISRDGRYIAWGDHAGRLHIVDRSLGKPVTMELNSGPVNSVFFCRDDAMFYVGTYGGYIHVVNPSEGKTGPEHSMKVHSGAVKAVHAAGNVVVSVAADMTIYVSEKPTLKRIKEFIGPTAIVNDVALDLENNQLVTVSRDRVVRLYEISSGAIIAQHNRHRYSVKSVALLEDGTIASGDYWGYVVIWDPRKDTMVECGRVAQNGISALRPYKHGFFASSYDGGVYEISPSGNHRERYRLFTQEPTVVV